MRLDSVARWKLSYAGEEEEEEEEEERRDDYRLRYTLLDVCIHYQTHTLNQTYEQTDRQTDVRRRTHTHRESELPLLKETQRNLAPSHQLQLQRPANHTSIYIIAHHTHVVTFSHSSTSFILVLLTIFHICLFLSPSIE